MKARRPGLWPAYRIPSLLALISIAGLIGALIGDGAFDMLSWLLLGGLIVLMAALVRR